MASSKGLKANKPTEFTSSRSCSKEFIQECDGYIQLTNPTASNASRIVFILSYVKGPAPTAWKRQYCLSRKNQTNTFDKFKKRFFDSFGDPNKKANALTKLECHIQGRNVTNMVDPHLFSPLFPSRSLYTLSPDSMPLTLHFHTSHIVCTVYPPNGGYLSSTCTLDPSSTCCTIRLPALRYAPYIRDILYAFVL